MKKRPSDTVKITVSPPFELGFHNTVELYLTQLESHINEIKHLLSVNKDIADPYIETEVEYDYEVSEIKVTLFGLRPWTDKKIAAEEAKLKKSLAKREAAERKQYQALKKKFGRVKK